MACWQQGFSWVSLSTLMDHHSGKVLYIVSSVFTKLVNVSFHNLANTGVFIGHLLFCSYFSSSAQHVLLEWFVRLEVSGHRAALFWDTASSFCSKQNLAFLHSFYPVFSPDISLEFKFGKQTYIYEGNRLILDLKPGTPKPKERIIFSKYNKR